MKMNRRQFLGFMSAIGAAATIPKELLASAPNVEPVTAELMFDPNDEHELLYGEGHAAPLGIFEPDNELTFYIAGYKIPGVSSVTINCSAEPILSTITHHSDSLSFAAKTFPAEVHLNYIPDKPSHAECTAHLNKIFQKNTKAPCRMSWCDANYEFDAYISSVECSAFVVGVEETMLILRPVGDIIRT